MHGLNKAWITVKLKMKKCEKGLPIKNVQTDSFEVETSRSAQQKKVEIDLLYRMRTGDWRFDVKLTSSSTPLLFSEDRRVLEICL